MGSPSFLRLRMAVKNNIDHAAPWEVNPKLEEADWGNTYHSFSFWVAAEDTRELEV
jgi:hypothetical protein